MNRIPVYVLTGYLGAGKTTALNSLLREPKAAQSDIALIINEFGSVGVDGKLVRKGAYSKYEINKGSLFCICTKTDFLRTLDEIAGSGRTQMVMIEATGIANTADIEGFILEKHLAGRFEVKANVCIIDAVNYTRAAAFLRTINEQLRWADGIVINKTGMVPPQDVRRLVEIAASINPRAKTSETADGNVGWEFVDSLAHEPASQAMSEKPPADLIAVSFQGPMRFDKTAFAKTLEGLGQRLLRLKGNVAFATGTEFVEAVFDRVTYKPAVEGTSETSFTAIAWQASKEELTEAFEAAETADRDS